MAEMCTAGAAGHLGADHAVADVAMLLDCLGGHRRVEARPAATGIELRFAAKKLRPAAGTGIDARRGLEGVFSGEWALGPLFAGDAVQFRGQGFRPFLVRFHWLNLHLCLPDTAVANLPQSGFLRG